MIKILIGGSPCTYWSIAQKNGRETEAKGLGWELFKNYLIAKEKFKPDFFLYENNKSAAQAIKDQIQHELGVWDGTLFMEDSGARYIDINSALVSAQNRQRFYVHNCGEVEQPKDRGILLKDILETTVAETVSVRLRGRQGMAKYEARDDYKSGAITAERIIEVAEPVCVQEQVKGRKANDDGTYTRQYEARIDGKSGTLTGTMRQNAVAEPVNITADGKAQCLRATYYKDGIRNLIANDIDRRTCVAQTVQFENIGECKIVQKAIPKLAEKYGYIPEQFNAYNVAEITDKSPTLSTGSMVTSSCATTIFTPVENSTITINGKKHTVYKVKDGLITIKGKQYPIKLAEGYYIIRKLTVTECERLQTIPDGYTSKSGVSASQCYKGLGNGWTAEVIKHILNNALKDIPKDEEIVVLSMYDGIGTGRYCLDSLGFTNVKYYAYEIDKYAMQIAKYNYPDIIEMGDAFQVREHKWTL